MNINELKMYCHCFADNLPRYTQFKQIPLMCGAQMLSTDKRHELSQLGFEFDDVGEHISDLNWTFGDLTGTYYIWKNSDAEFVGHNQYRRFWHEHTVHTLEPNTLYYSALSFLQMTLAQQYVLFHGEYGLRVLDTLPPRLFPSEHRDTFAQSYMISPCNMFFGQKAVYDRFCAVLFEILFEVYQASTDHLATLDTYQRRMIAFLAERVGTVLIHHHRYYFGTTACVPVPYIVVE